MYHTSETSSHWCKSVHNRTRHHSTSNVCTEPRYLYGSRLSLQSHIARQTGACFRALRQARALRRSLTTDASRMLISSAVLSRIDHCNWIFAGLPDLDNLLQVMNTTANVISRRRKYDHISNVQQALHWLAPSATTHRIQTVSHGSQGPTQPRNIVSSWTVYFSYCGSSQSTATFFIRRQSCSTEASIRVWQACFCLRWTTRMEQSAANDKIMDIDYSLQKTTEDIFSDNATNSPDFDFFVFFYLQNFSL